VLSIRTTPAPCRVIDPPHASGLRHDPNITATAKTNRSGTTLEVPLSDAVLDCQRRWVRTHIADRVTALSRAVLGTVAILLIALSMRSAPASALIVSLVPMWLTFASLIAYVGMHHAAQPGAQPRLFMPLRFSGPMGRFSLRRLGDGRHVQILAADAVVAELRATDARDEIDIHLVVSPEETRDLGSAVGQAIELVSDADEAHLDWDDHGATWRNWGINHPQRSGW
jgi:hypothetical protein